METAQIIEALREKFADKVTGVGSCRGQDWAVVETMSVATVCRFLKEDPKINMDYLVDVTAVDYSPDAPRFTVVYHMYSMQHGHRLRLKVEVDESDKSVPSVSGVWKTANWHERETYDLFGIVFTGHPDLRRILLPDEWEGHPLLKDYPLQGPRWEFTPWLEGE